MRSWDKAAFTSVKLQNHNNHKHLTRQCSQWPWKRRERSATSGSPQAWGYLKVWLLGFKITKQLFWSAVTPPTPPAPLTHIHVVPLKENRRFSTSIICASTLILISGSASPDLHRHHATVLNNRILFQLLLRWKMFYYNECHHQVNNNNSERPCWTVSVI